VKTLESGSRERAESPIILGVLAAFCAAYFPFLGGGVLTDDFAHLMRQRGWPSFTEVVSTPDPFGFYRPAVQASFWVNAHLFGFEPVAFRAINLFLHLTCIACVYRLACKLSLSSRASLLATLAFALTPKANSIAVLWISGRTDLMMALFCLMALLAWLRWRASRKTKWVLASVFCYVLAVLSKESAFLLPVLLPLLPTDEARAGQADIPVIVAMILCGVIVFVLRAHFGAMMPLTSNAHYALIQPLARWTRNLENYSGRVVPSALGVLLLVALPGWLLNRDLSQWDTEVFRRYLLFGVAWFVIFILPVLPIVARSELYLYFPGIGLALFVARIVDMTVSDRRRQWLMACSLAMYVVLFGAYQMSRSLVLSNDLDFSAALMSSLRTELEGYGGHVWLIPQDGETLQLFADSVGGYGDLLLKFATGRSEVNGGVEYQPGELSGEGLRLRCTYRAGTVMLARW